MSAIIETTLKLREAKASDLKLDDKNLILGVPYWLKSSVTGKLSIQNYYTSIDTDVFQLAEYLKFKMVYIPLSYFEQKEALKASA